METIAKKSDINISVSLNEDKHPIAIDWKADDSGLEGMHQSKAMMISLFDLKDHTTLRIDLWTKDMMVEEMQLFFYETLASMADTYERATHDKELSGDMRKFARTFGARVKIIR